MCFQQRKGKLHKEVFARRSCYLLPVVGRVWDRAWNGGCFKRLHPSCRLDSDHRQPADRLPCPQGRQPSTGQEMQKASAQLSASAQQGDLHAVRQAEQAFT